MGIGVTFHEDLVELLCLANGQMVAYRMPILTAMELRQDLQRAIERATKWEERQPEATSPDPQLLRQPKPETAAGDTSPSI